MTFWWKEHEKQYECVFSELLQATVQYDISVAVSPRTGLLGRTEVNEEVQYTH
jgi:hypothetical protein